MKLVAKKQIMKNKNSSENLTNLTTEMHIGYWTVVTNLKYFYIVSQKNYPVISSNGYWFSKFYHQQTQ